MQNILSLILTQILLDAKYKKKTGLNHHELCSLGVPTTGRGFSVYVRGRGYYFASAPAEVVKSSPEKTLFVSLL